MTPEMCLAIMREARAALQDNDSSAYSAQAREQLITVLYRFAKLVGLA